VRGLALAAAAQLRGLVLGCCRGLLLELMQARACARCLCAHPRPPPLTSLRPAPRRRRAGSELDTGINPAHLNDLNLFWEQTRELYAPFESNMKVGRGQHEACAGLLTWPGLGQSAADEQLGQPWLCRRLWSPSTQQPAAAPAPAHRRPRRPRAPPARLPCLMQAVSSDVYQHEMPGGQYTNLKFQAASLGLGAEWDKVCISYAAANRALGDIVKVRRPTGCRAGLQGWAAGLGCRAGLQGWGWLVRALAVPADGACRALGPGACSPLAAPSRSMRPRGRLTPLPARPPHPARPARR
jgi:hypothetical protein